MRPLIAIGNVNIDLILGPTKPWPQAGTEVIVDHDELRVGGCSGNNALVWDAFGLDYVIAANIGHDQFGSWLSKSFGEKAAKWTVEPRSTTLTVGITHPDGERTFFTTRGHLPYFTANKALEQFDGVALKGGLAILSGAFLTEQLSREYMQIFDWADQQSIHIALDTGWPMDGWTEHNRQQTLSWLKRSHVALFNEVETTNLTGMNDVHDAAVALQKHMPQDAVVVVKRGKNGAIAIGADKAFVNQAAPVVQVIDTIGAGDVFNAAFIAALAHNKSLQECLRHGVTIASEAISTSPRSYGSPISHNMMVINE